MRRMTRKHPFTLAECTVVVQFIDSKEDAILYKKLEVLHLKIEGYKNTEISAITKHSTSRVRAQVCVFINKSISHFEKDNRKGVNRRNLTFDEEARLIEISENTVICGWRLIQSTGRISENVRCFLKYSDPSMAAERMLILRRTYWQIENNLY